MVWFAMISLMNLYRIYSYSSDLLSYIIKIFHLIMALHNWIMELHMSIIEFHNSNNMQPGYFPLAATALKPQ